MKRRQTKIKNKKKNKKKRKKREETENWRNSKKNKAIIDFIIEMLYFFVIFLL